MKFLSIVKDVLTSQIQIGEYLLPFNPLDFILKILLPITASLILYKVIKNTILKSVSKSGISDLKKDSVKRWVTLSLRFILFTLAVLFVINLLGARITEYLLAFGNILTHPIVEDISITTIILILPILYLARLSGKLAAKFASTTIFPYLKINSSTTNMNLTILKNIIVVLVLLFGLTLIGFNLSLLYGLFGIIGIGIGFGLQGAVANLFAGLILLATKPVKVGDHIIVDGKEGELIEIRFVNSIISTIEHETIIIPNTKLIDNPVHNYSFDDRYIKIKNSVQVSYNSDVEAALEILKNISLSCPYLLEEKPVETRVVSFDDSGITLLVISWINNSAEKYSAMSWVNLEIWKAFRENGIEIPFPQLDISLKKN
ncbi:MAG: mechanosensitive ion channel [Spirochaetaceae bacterium]